jgi:hypothetical protein
MSLSLLCQIHTPAGQNHHITFVPAHNILKTEAQVPQGPMEAAEFLHKIGGNRILFQPLTECD